ncbi:hypothetical protein [Brevibacillus massiliensis]|uniref:hypothetical protein n=2 Tax=Brevibacillus massiliensis TaxID=1118054 RepID=UPI0021C3E418|nr:hypothetical protein [Brevibacillus massiliensis]
MNVVMEQRLARYYELKQLQKELEEELELIKREILDEHTGPCSVEAGDYKLSITLQERRDYDDNRLFNALPDASIWRLLSKADAGKISSMVKVQVINEEMLAGTYEIRHVPYLRVQKR